MFILNHVIYNSETDDTLVANFVFKTKEQAEKAKAKLDAEYDLVKDPSLDSTAYSDIREVNICTDNSEIINYLNDLNNVRLDVDDEYTEQEYEEVKNKINKK